MQIKKQQLRTGQGTTDSFQIGKGVCQGCILSFCLFNLYTKYIMRNAGLGEAQAGIKIARRNINNLRYADETTLMAESEEELKSLFYLFFLFNKVLFFKMYSWWDLFMHLHKQLGHLHPWCFWCKSLELCTLKPV